MTTFRRAALVSAAVLLSFGAFAQQALACPNCKTTVAATSEAGGQGDPARGFAVAIYVMLGAVAVLASAIGFLVVRVARRVGAADGEAGGDALH